MTVIDGSIRAAGSLALLGMLGACSMHMTPEGQHSTTVNSPFAVRAPAAATPRPPPGHSPEDAGPPADGPYEGTGTILVGRGARCQNRIAIRNWTVTGNQVRYTGGIWSGGHVRFATFTGTIGRDGGLTMQNRNDHIIGAFFGSHFSGHFWAPQPACTYAVTLDPVAR